MTKALAKKDQGQQLKQFLTAHKGKICDAVPQTMAKYLTPERVVKIALGAAQRNPILLQCDPLSMLKSMIDVVSLGLEPGSPLGHAYLVPFRNGKAGGRWEAQPIIGYQGYVDLAWRSGRLKSLFVESIREHDEYSVVYGSDARIEHKPKLIGERGDVIAVYCVAKFGEGEHFCVMTKEQIDEVARLSKSGNNGPWKTHWEEMAKKTVIRRARKLWPQSVEDPQMAKAIEIESSVESGTYSDLGDIVDAEFEDTGKSVTDALVDKLDPQEPPPIEDDMPEWK